jgi:cation diffusion facilitator family transporter
MVDIVAHYRRVRRILWGVLALNWLVAAAKIAYGYKTGSSSMTADGFHSLGDGTSNLVGLLGVYFSARPIDHDHPYGHRKFETLFAMGIAAMLVFVGYKLAQEGILHLRSGAQPQVTPVSFVVMLVTMAINISVMMYEYRRGKQLKSDVLVADSMHPGGHLHFGLRNRGPAGREAGLPGGRPDHHAADLGVYRLVGLSDLSPGGRAAGG